MSDLKSAGLTKLFAGIKQAQEPERAGGTQGTRIAQGTRGTQPGPRLAPLPSQATAKSKHPEYKAVKVFMRSENHRAAARKWRYDEGGDFSDLVDHLVEQYLHT